MVGLALDAFGLACPRLVGLGFGGWLAAELATTAQARLAALVLVAPMGIKPPAGEIFDQFQVSHEDYVRLGFHRQETFAETFGAPASTEQLVAWDEHREMTSRVAWKPYMFNRALPPLLRSVTVPSLVVWGDDDRIVPVECAAAYADVLTGAVSRTVPGCGHWVEMEQGEALAEHVLAFVR
jgi:pimeloyl-ACP methyl ester carboxylesterase